MRLARAIAFTAHLDALKEKQGSVLSGLQVLTTHKLICFFLRGRGGLGGES
jgi:hypothetical protein